MRGAGWNANAHFFQHPSSVALSSVASRLRGDTFSHKGRRQARSPRLSEIFRPKRHFFVHPSPLSDNRLDAFEGGGDDGWKCWDRAEPEALKRILAGLIAMAGLSGWGQSAFSVSGAQVSALAENSKPSPAPTLPRRICPMREPSGLYYHQLAMFVQERRDSS
jgi:hypothetical protein